jgi:SAM-dependent methyltransferase
MGQVNVLLAEVRSFMKSRIILTAAELDFFTFLDKNKCSVDTLAGKKGLNVRATTRVLDCLITFGLLKKRGAEYSLTDQGAFYSSHHSETILPMILHMNGLWNTWSNLTEVLKTGQHEPQEPGIHMDEEFWKSFIGAMHVIGSELAQRIASNFDVKRFRRLLDIGGASGTYTIAFLRQNPTMKAVIFDLKHVIPMAKEKLREEHLGNRVDLVVGDFYKDELPKGCDLALLSAIIHQNSLENNLDLFKKIYTALEPGGTVLIRDHIMDESRTKPASGAIFAINMLVFRHGGDTYTFSEIKAGLEQAGFTDVRQVQYGEEMDGIVVGQKPA